MARAERFLVFGTDQDRKMPPERKLLLVLNAAAEAFDLLDVLQVLGIDGRQGQCNRRVEVLLFVELVLVAEANGLAQHERKGEFVKPPEIEGERTRRRVLDAHDRAVFPIVNDDVLFGKDVATVGELSVQGKTGTVGRRSYEVD